MGGIVHCGKNVFALKGRIIGEDFLERRAAGDQFENVGHADVVGPECRDGLRTCLPRP